ncbi:MAG: response regulator transcription factor [Nitrospira sp.]|nr:response regulator transcription factor [Nitrospira sp.]
MTPSTGTRDHARVLRVLLVDASPFVLQGIQEILAKNPQVRVVGTARTTDDALVAVRTSRPTVVVSEVQVGRASGIDLCRTIRESYPQISVLFFTHCDEQHLLRSAILAGAQGYLLKKASAETVVRGIEIVSEGLAIMDPQLTPQIIAWVREQGQGRHVRRLYDCSAEEIRVLALMSAGRTNQEIAHRLKIPLGKLSTRLRALYKRLNISRRSEVAKYYAEWRKENHQTGDEF